MFAEAEAELLRAATDDDRRLDAMVAARIAGAPLEHVLGWAELAGRRYAVGPGVFVPRPRSELLVTVARERIAAIDRPVVVDLCCGTGALGLAVVAGRPVDRRAELHAADVDEAATRWARRNLGARGQVWTGDLFDPLPDRLRGAVDLVLASAPYVPTDAIRLLPPEARDHEPRQALDGGVDGLDVYRRIAAAAADWLAPTGLLALEASADQANELTSIVRQAGLLATAVTDEWDSTVVVGARLRGSGETA